MTLTPTLLDDLEFAADHFEAVSRDMAPIKPMRADTAARAARLRAHAARLREEMARADTRWTESTSTVVRGLLERINGGPLEP